jgi:tellurite resistance protein
MSSVSKKVLDAAAEIGLSEETLELVRLLPMVHVAWADGEIQPEELSVILELAEAVGLQNPRSVEILQGWLEARPEAAFFQQGLKLLSYLVAGLSDAEAQQAESDVISMCELVASAAGGLVGHVKRIDPTERAALRQIELRLQLASRPETRGALKSVVGNRG